MSYLTPEKSTPLAELLKSQVSILAGWTAIAWGLEAIDQLVLQQSLDRYGIRPGDVDGLWGILVAPLLHGSFAHLAANTVPFLVLGWLVSASREGNFFAVSSIVILLGGFGVWLTGRENSVHIGASGVIFGYLGFLLCLGFFQRSLGALIIALVVGVLYGGLVVGVLPGEPGVSWQGHLCGFIGGAVAAKILARKEDSA